MNQNITLKLLRYEKEIMKAKLIKCDLCCFDYATYDFFEADESDYYIVEYEFRQSDGEGTTDKVYNLMRKGRYRDGGIALVIDGQMLYSFGKKCFITGYCPVDIEK